ncbi:hypothetical protein HanIR_Chr01g0043881 [Helianthus annuus]|nr:hypothetical protein HanIR_Chr01g0043881 [Helianthus annuus]
MCHVPVINSHFAHTKIQAKMCNPSSKPNPSSTGPHLITSHINHKEHHLFSNISGF